MSLKVKSFTSTVYIPVRVKTRTGIYMESYKLRNKRALGLNI